MKIVFKVFLGLIGLICALYTVMAIFQVVATAKSGNLASAEGSGDMIGSFIPVLLGLAGCVVCFRYSFKRQRA